MIPGTDHTIANRIGHHLAQGGIVIDSMALLAAVQAAHDPLPCERTADPAGWDKKMAGAAWEDGIAADKERLA